MLEKVKDLHSNMVLLKVLISEDYQKLDEYLHSNMVLLKDVFI